MTESVSGAEELVLQTVVAAEPADAEVFAQTQILLDAKAKPRRSLGRLEELACRVASIRRSTAGEDLRAAVVVAVADHGIAAEGVSAYPQEVTTQMIANFVRGGAAICVLARRAGARVVVVDAGTATPVEHPDIVARRIGSGTASSTAGPAMSIDEAFEGIASGIELATELIGEGVGVMGVGEMGIANTASASALAAALIPARAAEVCGRGTGLDDEGLARKVWAVTTALDVNAATLGDPVGALAALGGFEIATLVGVILACAAHRTPVVLDGFITGAAALVAVRIAPAVIDSMVASHRSSEPGHARILEVMDLRPLLELDMRLGEGTGAALALPIVGAAQAVLREMATFDEAGVSDSGA